MNSGIYARSPSDLRAVPALCLSADYLEIAAATQARRAARRSVQQEGGLVKGDDHFTSPKVELYTLLDRIFMDARTRIQSSSQVQAVVFSTLGITTVLIECVCVRQTARLGSDEIAPVLASRRYSYWIVRDDEAKTPSPTPSP